jgi:hypothetical protein
MKNNIIRFFERIKWVFKTILVILGIIPFFRCSSGYKEKDGKVTFNGKEITDKSFVVLNEDFAKNDSSAYYKSYSISDADVKTFVALDAHYAKDKNNAYYCDEEREGQNYYLTKHKVIVKIKGVDAESFKLIGESYEGFAKDKKQGYLKGKSFLVKDVATLTIVEGQFLKDKYHVYFQQKIVENADVHTFRLIDKFYAKDTARVYYYGYYDEANKGIYQIPCNPNSFSLLEYPYSKDNIAVFYVFSKINGADANSFKVVGNGFSKDKSHVYIKTKILKGADAASFMIIPHEESLDDFNYSKDKHRVFYKDKMFSKVDLLTFKVLGLDYATDGKHVFHKTNIVKNADPATFKVYDHGYAEDDAEDEKIKFFKGKMVRKNQ